MKLAKISQGGQIQIPAEVRHRWKTRTVLVEDGGGFLRISPVPQDPISAAAGALAGEGPSAVEMLRRLREDEAAAESRKWKQLGQKR